MTQGRRFATVRCAALPNSPPISAIHAACRRPPFRAIAGPSRGAPPRTPSGRSSCRRRLRLTRTRTPRAPGSALSMRRSLETPGRSRERSSAVHPRASSAAPLSSAARVLRSGPRAPARTWDWTAHAHTPLQTRATYPPPRVCAPRPSHASTLGVAGRPAAAPVLAARCRPPPPYARRRRRRRR